MEVALQNQLIQVEVEEKLTTVIHAIPDKQMIPLLKKSADTDCLKLMCPAFVSKTGIFVKGFAAEILISDIKIVWFRL